jgi:hypothetical protein
MNIFSLNLYAKKYNIFICSACFFVSSSCEKKYSKSEEERITRSGKHASTTDNDTTTRKLNEVVSPNKVVVSLPDDIFSGKEFSQSRRSLLLKYIDTEDLDKCKELFTKLPISDFRTVLLERFSHRFAVTDIKSACLWLESLDQKSENRKAYGPIAREAAKNPDLAYSVLSNINNSAIREEFYLSFLLASAAVSLDTSLKMLAEDESYYGGISTDRLLATIASSVSQSPNSADIGKLIDYSIEKKCYSELVANELKSGLNKINIEDLKSLIVRYSDVESSDSFVMSIADSWARREPVELSSWLLTQEGSVRDVASSSFAKAIANNEPASAIKWADSISNTSLRLQTLQHIVMNSQIDKMELKSLINQIAKDEKEKSDLLRSANAN